MSTFTDKQQIRHLWELCFHETKEFVDMYFKLRYSPEVTLCTRNNHHIVAALQMLPYSMTYHGSEIAISYISGACTHPDYRKQGIMYSLLSEAFKRMYEERIQLSTLIPATPHLVDYYAHKGYVPVFRYAEHIFIPTGTTMPKTGILKRSNRFNRGEYEYLNRKLHERPCCIQHTPADYKAIVNGLRLDNGLIYTLKRQNAITALALAYPEEETQSWYLGECLADSPAYALQLQTGICQELGLSSLRVLTPPVPGEQSHVLGMGRIIRAHDMLQRYAAAHPDCQLNISLTDSELEANSGYYCLSNGICTKNAKQPTGSYLALTIGQLAEKICSTPAPYMSLMLN